MSKAEQHTQEIKLYGINHGVAISGMFGTTFFDVAPPDEFLDFYGITPDTLVGIEATSGTARYANKHHEDDLRQWDLKSDGFFRLACQTLQAAGVPMALLDSVGLTREFKPAAADRAQELRSKGEGGDGWLTDREMQEYGYLRSALSMIDLWREPIMFGRVRQMKPDVVVLGQAHADVLAASPELQKRYRVAVTDYAHILPVVHPGDSYAQESAEGFERYEHELPSYIKVPSDAEVKQFVTEHENWAEQARRQFNAFTIGRVLGSEMPKPSYLGRFYITDTAAYSLFEVGELRREGNSFEAQIVDVHGGAAMTGAFSGDGTSVVFEKRYTRSLSGKKLPTWIYKGNVDPSTGLIRGRYGLPGEQSGACFVMAPFFETPRDSTLKLLDDRSRWDPRSYDAFNVRHL